MLIKKLVSGLVAGLLLSTPALAGIEFGFPGAETKTAEELNFETKYPIWEQGRMTPAPGYWTSHQCAEYVEEMGLTQVTNMGRCLSTVDGLNRQLGLLAEGQHLGDLPEDKVLWFPSIPKTEPALVQARFEEAAATEQAAQLAAVREQFGVEVDAAGNVVSILGAPIFSTDAIIAVVKEEFANLSTGDESPLSLLQGRLVELEGQANITTADVIAVVQNTILEQNLVTAEAFDNAVDGIKDRLMDLEVEAADNQNAIKALVEAGMLTRSEDGRYQADVKQPDYVEILTNLGFTFGDNGMVVLPTAGLDETAVRQLISDRIGAVEGQLNTVDGQIYVLADEQNMQRQALDEMQRQLDGVRNTIGGVAQTVGEQETRLAQVVDADGSVLVATKGELNTKVDQSWLSGLLQQGMIIAVIAAVVVLLWLLWNTWSARTAKRMAKSASEKTDSVVAKADEAVTIATAAHATANFAVALQTGGVQLTKDGLTGVDFVDLTDGKPIKVSFVRCDGTAVPVLIKIETRADGSRYATALTVERQRGTGKVPDPVSLSGLYGLIERADTSGRLQSVDAA